MADRSHARRVEEGKVRFSLAGVALLAFCIPHLVLAAEFGDDFTDDAYNQAHWSFLSPWHCANEAFTGSGAASAMELCINSPVGAGAFGLPSVAIAYVNQPFDMYQVSVLAGVSFTAAELTG